MEFDESQPYQAALDDEGTIYYFHTETHESMLEPPAGYNAFKFAGSSWVVINDSEGDPYYWNMADNATTLDRPDAAIRAGMESLNASGGANEEWLAVKDASGGTYYWNVNTGETTYEAIEGWAGATMLREVGDWKLLSNGDSEFWWNIVTNATQIETPEDALMRPQGGVFSSPLARAAQESPVVAVGAAAAGGPPRPKQQYLTNSEKDGAPFVEAEFEGYIAHFFDIDTEPGGFITAANMAAFAKAQGYELSASQVRELIADKDANGDGKVSIREFVAATRRPMPFDKPWLWDILYVKFGKGHTGMDRDALRRVLLGMEMAFTEEHITTWMKGATKLPRHDFIRVFLPDYNPGTAPTGARRSSIVPASATRHGASTTSRSRLTQGGAQSSRTLVSS